MHRGLKALSHTGVFDFGNFLECLQHDLRNLWCSFLVWLNQRSKMHLCAVWCNRCDYAGSKVGGTGEQGQIRKQQVCAVLLLKLRQSGDGFEVGASQRPVSDCPDFGFTPGDETDVVPIEETLEALHDVVKAGKARYIGASSMWAWQFAKMQFTAESAGTSRFVSMQNHYSLLHREEEREMHPLLLDQGVATVLTHYGLMGDVTLNYSGTNVMMTMGMVLSVPLLMVGIWLMWRAGRIHGKAEA